MVEKQIESFTFKKKFACGRQVVDVTPNPHARGAYTCVSGLVQLSAVF